MSFELLFELLFEFLFELSFELTFPEWLGPNAIESNLKFNEDNDVAAL